MTTVTLILDEFDEKKHGGKLGEFEMPWGQIGNLVFRIQRKDNPVPTVVNECEQRIATQVDRLIAEYMVHVWQKFNETGTKSVQDPRA